MMKIDLLNPSQLDTPMDDLDGILMLIFNSAEISNFFVVDRQTIGSNTIIYKIRSKNYYVPRLGQIQLSSIQDGTLVTTFEPAWPTFDEETTYKLYVVDKTGHLPTNEFHSLRIQEEGTDESFDVKSQARGIQLQAWEKFKEFFLKVFENLMRSQVEGEDPKDEDTDEEKGPTLRTRERFKVFDRIKGKDPTLTQVAVAQIASKELGIKYNENTVRNTYRSMGVKWERGDRVR